MTSRFMARRISGAVLTSVLLSGCLSAPEPPQVATAAPTGPPPISGWLAAPGAPALDEADRERAFAAEVAAAESGRRTSWRSPRGNFGIVEPAPVPTGACRAYTHTVYLDGKAQRGGGTACLGTSGLLEIKA
jgi:surface antigen